MAWDMLRRLLKILGGKFVSKMAPRLLFFQYYDRIALELEEQKKKVRIAFQLTPADHALRQLLSRSQLLRSGMSTLLEESRDDSDAVSVLELHGHEDFWDDRTVSSHYLEQSAWEYDLVELQAFFHSEMPVSCATRDGGPLLPSCHDRKHCQTQPIQKNYFLGGEFSLERKWSADWQGLIHIQTHHFSLLEIYLFAFRNPFYLLSAQPLGVLCSF